MTPAPDDRWRRRFLVFAALRVSGLLIFFIGMAIIFSDLLRPGGFLELGLVVVGLGLAEALLGPVLLKRMWDKQSR
jgi:hypothetical protein